MTKQPKAFISYSSLDKEVVRQLAADLRSKGVEAWYDEWEVRPGDSLVDKINQGIENCEYFIVILSENSIKSKWVREELNTATIRRIQEQAKLIPVRIDNAPVPTLLVHISYINFSSHNQVIQSLVDVLFERNIKPPLGDMPNNALPEDASKERNLFNLTPLGLDVAEWLYYQDKEGMIWISANIQNIIEELNQEEVEIEDAVEELESSELVEYTKQTGLIRTKEGLPLAVIGRLNYDLLADMLLIARTLVQKQEITQDELRDVTQLEIARLNKVVWCLAAQGLAKALTAMGVHPFAFFKVMVTRETRQFVKKNQDIELG